MEARRPTDTAYAASELGTAYGALMAAALVLPEGSALATVAEAIAEKMAAILGHDDLVASLSPRERLSVIAQRMERRARATLAV